MSLTVVDHVTTANLHARLDAIANVWRKIYSTHQKGEPSAHAFFQKYGEYMKTNLCKLETLTQTDLVTALKQIKPSAPGMDHFPPLN